MAFEFLFSFNTQLLVLIINFVAVTIFFIEEDGKASARVVLTFFLIWGIIGVVISGLLYSFFQVPFITTILSYNLISLILFILYGIFWVWTKISGPIETPTKPAVTSPTRENPNTFSDKSTIEEDPSDDSRYISSEVKKAVMERDRGKCVICGNKRHLHYDHDIPVSKGGGNTVNNIRILCRDCNLRKSDKIE